MSLTVHNLTKRFGPTVACDDVSFEVRPGEILGILGENGAGKSTLLSMIAGFVPPDSGSIHVGDAELRSGDPASSLSAGAGTAFQHGSLVPEFTVRETFALARVESERGIESLGAGLPPETIVGSLGVAEQQRLELAKARMLASRVLQLDEPTSLLGDDDAAGVMHVIRESAASGVACIFVTHRIREVLAVADHLIVMRAGRVVHRVTREDTGWRDDIEQTLLDAMFGPESRQPPAGEAAVHARSDRDVSTGHIVISGVMNDSPMSLTLPRGRVIGIVGIGGNGQRGLDQLLTGKTASSVESIDVAGNLVHMGGRAVAEWFRGNVAVVPEDRVREGGALSMSVAENLAVRDLVIGRTVQYGVARPATLRSRGARMIDRWRIRPANPEARFGELSGGNMQRVILARALDPPPELLVAVGVTHGLDHQSAIMVRDELRVAADAGVTVISFEHDLDEALRHSDVIGVMYGGRLSELLPVDLDARADVQRMMVMGWSKETR